MTPIKILDSWSSTYGIYNNRTNPLPFFTREAIRTPYNSTEFTNASKESHAIIAGYKELLRDVFLGRTEPLLYILENENCSVNIINEREEENAHYSVVTKIVISGRLLRVHFTFNGWINGRRAASLEWLTLGNGLPVAGVCLPTNIFTFNNDILYFQEEVFKKIIKEEGSLQCLIKNHPKAFKRMFENRPEAVEKMKNIGLASDIIKLVKES